MKSLESKYSTTIVAQFLNLLSLGYHFDHSALQSIAKVALSIQYLTASVERTRSMLATFRSEFIQELEHLDSELAAQASSCQEMIETFEKVR